MGIKACAGRRRRRPRGVNFLRYFRAHRLCEHLTTRSFSGTDRIHEKHRHGHRSDAARHWRNHGGPSTYRFEIAVSDKLPVGKAIDSDVDDDSARFHHWSRYKIWASGGDDQDVGKDGELSKISRLSVAN